MQREHPNVCVCDDFNCLSVRDVPQENDIVVCQAACLYAVTKELSVAPTPDQQKHNPRLYIAKQCDGVDQVADSTHYFHETQINQLNSFSVASCPGDSGRRAHDRGRIAHASDMRSFSSERNEAFGHFIGDGENMIGMSNAISFHTLNCCRITH